ncbi:mannan endo-1-6-alpha-mannosidase [Penicillium malachiteum]|nr:mannan endo-1-6-alpha-mannosidase [Penicillium malachiteum]
MRSNYVAQIATVILPTLLFPDHVSALTYNSQQEDTIKAAASKQAYAMMSWYHGNETGQTPGAFQFSWWEGAALCNAMLNYWHFTGDDTYNDELSVALQWQGGDNGDYLNANFSQYAGNDDQMQWGAAAMTAAEYKLPDRSSGYSWLSLVQGVYNNQKDNTEGWDPSTCGGGFRWQKTPFQGTGYNLKNAVSNGGFMMLAARLANYLNESSYADWAEKTWEWSMSVKLVNNQTWGVGDSVDGSEGCKTVDQTQWTYNYGVYMMGCAHMYAYSNDTKWLTALNGLLDKLWSTFFLAKYGDAIAEITCEGSDTCDRNGMLFKGLTVMWLSNIALIVPSTYDAILAKIQSSAVGAASTCTGEGNGTCGVRWWGSYDGQSGMEPDISATNVFSVAMLPFVNQSEAKPATQSTGGNSTSDPTAGTADDDSKTTTPISSGDRAGAGILTVALVGGVVGMAVFMLMGQ